MEVASVWELKPIQKVSGSHAAVDYYCRVNIIFEEHYFWTKCTNTANILIKSIRCLIPILYFLFPIFWTIQLQYDHVTLEHWAFHTPP